MSVGDSFSVIFIQPVQSELIDMNLIISEIAFNTTITKHIHAPAIKHCTIFDSIEYSKVNLHYS